MIDEDLRQSIIQSSCKVLRLEIENHSPADCFSLYCLLIDNESIESLQILDFGPSESEIAMHLKNEKLKSLLFAFAGKSSLTNLELNLGKINKATVQILGQILPKLFHLNQLTITETRASTEVMNALLGTLALATQINHLHLPDNKLDYRYTKALTRLIKHRSWEQLNLAGNRVNHHHLAALWLKNPDSPYHIQHLNISNQVFSREFFKHIVMQLKKGKVLSFSALELSYTTFNKKSLLPFAEILSLSQSWLSHLSLAYAKMSIKNSKVLLGVLYQKPVDSLNLVGMKFTSELTAMLIHLIQHNPHLKTLKLSENRFTPTLKGRLCEAVLERGQLARLYFILDREHLYHGHHQRHLNDLMLFLLPALLNKPEVEIISFESPINIENTRLLYQFLLQNTEQLASLLMNMDSKAVSSETLRLAYQLYKRLHAYMTSVTIQGESRPAIAMEKTSTLSKITQAQSKAKPVLFSAFSKYSVLPQRHPLYDSNLDRIINDFIPLESDGFDKLLGLQREQGVKSIHP